MTLSAGKVDLLTRVFTMNTKLLNELQKHQLERPLIERHNKPHIVPAYIEAFTIIICFVVIMAGLLSPLLFSWGSL
tara:strand:+ start:202 stop:429 length:228 start_codon:yes stop_codon:yes gene_type:complete